MYGHQPKANTDSLVCGREIPGKAVGRQGATVECRNQIFELFPGPVDPQTKKADFRTSCISCRAQDPMSIIFTGIGAQTTLSQHGHLVCPCGQARWRLIDKGNEVFATCAHCNQRQQLGYTAGATAR
jgi:hypothetical protein